MCVSCLCSSDAVRLVRDDMHCLVRARSNMAMDASTHLLARPCRTSTASMSRRGYRWTSSFDSSSLHVHFPGLGSRVVDHVVWNLWLTFVDVRQHQRWRIRFDRDDGDGADGCEASGGGRACAARILRRTRLLAEEERGRCASCGSAPGGSTRALRRVGHPRRRKHDDGTPRRKTRHGHGAA